MRIGDTTYEALPGRARKMFGLLSTSKCRLFLSVPAAGALASGEPAPRHLLHVRRGRYSETYRRFDLRDIQALALARTGMGMVANTLLIIVGSLLAMIAAGAYSEPDFGPVLAGVLGGAAFVAFASLAINTFLGPTCDSYLKTNVLTEELPSLSRLRTAQRVFDILRPHVEAAQGGPLTPEQMSGGLAETRQQALSPHEAAVARDTGEKTPVQQQPLRLSLHVLLFSLILADSPVSALLILFEDPLPAPVLMLWFLVMAACSLGVVIRQRHMPLTKGLKVLPCLALGYVGLSFFLSTFLSGIIQEIMLGTAMTTPGASGDSDAMRVFTDAFNYFSVIFDLAVGMMGLLLVRDIRRPKTQQEPRSRRDEYRPRGEDLS